MTTFIISDTHFGHAGIINMCARPFANVRDMDDAMIAGWNAVVGKDDTVIHLGDFCHRAADGQAAKIFGALKGKKVLVRGNHDGKVVQSLPWISQHDILYASIDSTNIVGCHYPMMSWPKIRRGALQIYGHTHGRIPGSVQSCDVGVDVLGWSPVRLSTIKDHMATLPLRVDPEAGHDIQNDGGMKL